MYLDEAESSLPGKMWSTGTSEKLEDTLKSLGLRYLAHEKTHRLRGPLAGGP